ncbi:MAG: SpoVR family protein [Chitinivibrionales bacterium]|nr:SpoVR family protein [Chitinivibrionales bacterium]
MVLIDQDTKRIMEGCKERARDHGLRFDDRTLEYVVTNRDLLELTPKLMIPTLYDYWVHDIELLKERGRYELYPNNPYETVINTRPAISFYNDNNPDWLNVLIFYHVLAHIDFFQNNQYFCNTWDDDFAGRALSDKRLIAKLRSEKGRWVDYVIEFARGVDNLVGYHRELGKRDEHPRTGRSARLDYYFDVFLQSVKKVSVGEYIKELQRYNASTEQYGETGEDTFFADVIAENPEFESLLEKYLKRDEPPCADIMEYLMRHSPFLNRQENEWMKSVLEVVRTTSLFFQPQIRTKIMNEGWASYWHEKLFLSDDRIKGHEVDFARIHAGIAALPRVGMNPYALGMRLFDYIEDLGNRGRYSFEFRRMLLHEEREKFDGNAGRGEELMFHIRRNFCDGLFLDTFLDQDFVDRHDLFVAGRRLVPERMVWEYYVKSRSAEEFRRMIADDLYHPPYLTIDESKNDNNTLYLVHHFEGKQLVTDYIANTMLGLEYLWGGPIRLETSEAVWRGPGGRVYHGTQPQAETNREELELSWRRVLYTMKDRKLTRKNL